MAPLSILAKVHDDVKEKMPSLVEGKYGIFIDKTDRSHYNG